ncbi:MAG: hypothetical protein LBI19_03235 [Oscillospiraceae bacterium]|jgi:hypothetical protein|nr:hypothetical protein [Oscillospiraceae bacterium]
MPRIIDVSARDAAMMVGMDRRRLEVWIKSGKCPFGEYIREDGREKGSYYINRTRLERYASGVDMNPICMGKVLFPGGAA